MIEFLCVSYSVFVFSLIITIYAFRKELNRVDEHSAERFRFCVDEIYRVESNLSNFQSMNKKPELVTTLPRGVNRSFSRKRIVQERSKRGTFKKIKRQLKDLS